MGFVACVVCTNLDLTRCVCCSDGQATFFVAFRQLLSMFSIREFDAVVIALAFHRDRQCY